MNTFFLFGSAEQMAHMYYDSTVSKVGPGVPDLHPDEMGRQELIDHMVYMGMSALEARKDEHMEAAQLLHDWYDELFVRVVEMDEGFKSRLTTGKFRPLKAGYDRNKGYYLKLAGIL
tara:strand:+ start:315 stop:665 length:351 start_codon:yes stop_codon:yes gene_type:complete